MKIEFQKALVTGGAGFIGSHLVDALVGGGCRVVVLDDLSTGRLDNLNRVRQTIEFHQRDVRDANSVAVAAADCDVIFHQAAVVSVPYSVDHPLESAHVNEIGTLNVLEAARIHRIRRVVFASSCAVYGDDPALPKHESMPIKPISPYALQKAIGEQYAALYKSLHQMDMICLRYFNVFGPRQDPSSAYSGVISIFMQHAVTGKQPSIYGDGNQTRDFVFVSDVVAANLAAAQAPVVEEPVYNIGSQNAVSINELWSCIRDLAGITLDPHYKAPRSGDLLASRADIRAAASKLGFSPRYSFEKGLEITFDWYKNAYSAGK